MGGEGALFPRPLPKCWSRPCPKAANRNEFVIRYLVITPCSQRPVLPVEPGGGDIAHIDQAVCRRGECVTVGHLKYTHRQTHLWCNDYYTYYYVYHTHTPLPPPPGPTCIHLRAASHDFTWIYLDHTWIQQDSSNLDTASCSPPFR